MSEREEVRMDGGDNTRQRKDANIYVHKPKRGQNKPGKDRRFALRSKQFDSNTIKKMDGYEVPKTLRVSKWALIWVFLSTSF